MTPARRAGSTTHISVILDVVDHSGFPGYLPKRVALCCLLTQGRGNSLARTAGSGLPRSRTALCSSGRTSQVKERSRDATAQPRCSCDSILSVHGRKGRWRMKERLKRPTKPGKKKGCLIFSKRQAILWMVTKRRWFPWLCNNSINQSWALQKWHLALFFFCRKWRTKYFSSKQAVVSWRGFLVFPSSPGKWVQVTQRTC